MNQEFKDLISRIKYEYGLTQKEIAERIGVNSTYISEVISGKHPFSDSLREKIDSNFVSISNSVRDVNGNSNIIQSPSATINAPDPELIRSLRDEIVRLNDQIVWMRGLIDKLSAK